MHTFGLFVVKLGDENSVSTTDYLGSSGEVLDCRLLKGKREGAGPSSSKTQWLHNRIN